MIVLCTLEAVQSGRGVLSTLAEGHFLFLQSSSRKCSELTCLAAEASFASRGSCELLLPGFTGRLLFSK